MIIGVDKNLALDDLTTEVGRREGATQAVLVAIGAGKDPAGNDDTALTLDGSKPVPAKPPKVRLKVGATCVVAANETLVCQGRAFISGTLRDVCVTRPK